MKTILISLILTILLASVFSYSNSQVSKEFFEGFFEYRSTTFKFNENCLSNKINSEYEKIENVILAKWLDLGDVFRVLSEVEGAISAECDFPELKNFNKIYTEQVNNGNYMKNVGAKAIYVAQIIRDLYDSANRKDPTHIGTAMGKIADYLVYVEKGLKFLD